MRVRNKPWALNREWASQWLSSRKKVFKVVLFIAVVSALWISSHKLAEHNMKLKTRAKLSQESEIRLHYLWYLLALALSQGNRTIKGSKPNDTLTRLSLTKDFTLRTKTLSHLLNAFLKITLKAMLRSSDQHHHETQSWSCLLRVLHVSRLWIILIESIELIELTELTELTELSHDALFPQQIVSW